MKLLTESQVAELYGITKPCLRRWRHERRGLPFVKVGRLVRYRQSDVEAFISSNVQGCCETVTVSQEEVGVRQ
jgi:excisionase family DNA binding protein